MVHVANYPLNNPLWRVRLLRTALANTLMNSFIILLVFNDWILWLSSFTLETFKAKYVFQFVLIFFSSLLAFKVCVIKSHLTIFSTKMDQAINVSNRKSLSHFAFDIGWQYKTLLFCAFSFWERAGEVIIASHTGQERIKIKGVPCIPFLRMQWLAKTNSQILRTPFR